MEVVGCWVVGMEVVGCWVVDVGSGVAVGWLVVVVSGTGQLYLARIR